MTATLVLETHFLGRILVVRPVGELIPKTYERLRDGLVEYAAEEPAAIVVDLSGMRAAIASLLTVFPTVRDRISDWPGVVADADPRPPLLRVPGLRAAGGRGLVLVDKLSRRWGTASRRPNGKVVWATLTVASRMRTRAHPSRAHPPSAPSAARCSSTNAGAG
ncbi:MAG TPA: hypothetical protein VGP04_20400 [Pseudonocardiaceae bacterium]|jgi:hypothetical protein|nr:hypothetical protein [Pseudonocardiaceae bacterium]